MGDVLVVGVHSDRMFVSLARSFINFNKHKHAKNVERGGGGPRRFIFL